MIITITPAAGIDLEVTDTAAIVEQAALTRRRVGSSTVSNIHACMKAQRF